MKKGVFKDLLKRKIINIFRRGRLHTPMDMVILYLEAYKFFPKPLIALELFGRNGLWVTADYAPLCKYLEIWEIDPYYAKFAQKFLKNSVVKIGDSIKAVKRKILLKKEYNFINIDNPVWSPYGEGYYEHFDLFPDIFNYLDQKAVLVITVLFNMNIYAASQKQKVIPQEWIRKRKEFYGIRNDSEVINMDVKRMVSVYKNKVPQRNFNVVNIFLIPRSLRMGHLVMCVEKVNSNQG